MAAWVRAVGILRWGGLGLCLWAIAPAVLAQDPVQINERFRTYTVEGKTADEVVASMRAQTPVKLSATRWWAAWTGWNVGWTYRYRQTNAGCVAHSIEVMVDIEITLPDWKPRTRVPEVLTRQWKRYAAAVRDHEDGHAQLAKDAGREIARMIQSTRTPTCDSFERLVDEAGNRRLVQLRADNQAFDRRTDHGRLTGARLGR